MQDAQNRQEAIKQHKITAFAGLEQLFWIEDELMSLIDKWTKEIGTSSTAIWYYDLTDNKMCRLIATGNVENVNF